MFCSKNKKLQKERTLFAQGTGQEIAEREMFCLLKKQDNALLEETLSFKRNKKEIKERDDFVCSRNRTIYCKKRRLLFAHRTEQRMAKREDCVCLKEHEKKLN